MAPIHRIAARTPGHSAQPSAGDVSIKRHRLASTVLWRSARVWANAPIYVKEK
jgi:hypothetical protein